MTWGVRWRGLVGVDEVWAVYTDVCFVVVVVVVVVVGVVVVVVVVAFVALDGPQPLQCSN